MKNIFLFSREGEHFQASSHENVQRIVCSLSVFFLGLLHTLHTVSFLNMKFCQTLRVFILEGLRVLRIIPLLPFPPDFSLDLLPKSCSCPDCLVCKAEEIQTRIKPEAEMHLEGKQNSNEGRDFDDLSKKMEVDPNFHCLDPSFYLLVVSKRIT